MTSYAEQYERIIANAPPDQKWNVLVRDSTGIVLDIDSDEPVDGYSLNKLPIVEAVRELGLPPQTVLRVPEVRAGGTGILRYFPTGFEISAADAARLTLAESDTTAAIMLVRAVGGPAAVNEALANSRLELGATQLEVFDDDTFFMGKTSAWDQLELINSLAKSTEFASALRSSHTQHGIREGAEATNASAPHDMLLAGLKTFSKIRAGAWVPLPVYRAIMKHMALPVSDVALKEGQFDDKEEGVFARHQVASVGSVSLAALSRHQGEGPYDGTHPATPIQRQLGRTMRDHAHSDNQAT